ncbi:glycosyltransferase [Agrobacterium tumefaciens]|nr:glycosyltransferase family 4 protein [Agrobacterium tumefaciens]NTC82454.1 glycosyltransferase [Agrobacterium tumefaciens]NTD11277.1 glycosyltransferase [Agrobacterium tumefaciens]NTD86759.1 glycosyltransferase [Agrobacterium tumefaciens]NTD91486.1 glycosyltransferase [Agrobacterium tumefaciens]NTD96957.1 glycosyltransferase [Agrobacterium tumefaciens]
MANVGINSGFSWNREWMPLVSRYEVITSSGPEDAGQQSAPVALLDIADTPCLVLLSEPGMGKTSDLASLAQSLLDRGEQVDLVSVRDPDFAGVLDALLVSDHCLGWTDEHREWHILIDGVDELAGGLDPKRLLEGFLDRLFALGKRGRLKIAFTCRTSAWTDQLDQMVKDRWPPDAHKRLSLLPLADSQILSAINSFELSAENRAILTAHLSNEKMRAVAGRPLLLAILLDQYRKGGTFPTRQADLIYTAILAALGSVDGSSVDVQLAMAGRLAAACTFSDIRRLTTAVGSTDTETLSVSSIAGGIEPTKGGLVTATPAQFSLCLKSPLFVEVAPKTFQWSHRIFSDFLTARYLADHRLSAEEILSLLIVPEIGGPGGVALHLTEVAGWTAVMVPGVFSELIDRQPDVLLQSQALALEPADRARLTEALLDRLANGELLDRYNEILPLLGRLDHDGLEEQLLPLITRDDTPPFQRRAAIDLAAEAGKTSLSGVILNVATAPRVDGILRTIAARSVRKLIGTKSDELLAPILFSDLTSDTDDRLRGTVLQASWPGSLSFRQLLLALTAPKRSNLIGPYQMFLSRFEAPEMTAEQALETIEWLNLRLDADGDGQNYLETVGTRLFWASAGQVAAPQVADAMAAFIVAADRNVARFTIERGDRTSHWPNAPLARATLVDKILQRSQDALRSVILIFQTLPDLLVPNDLSEYLAKITGTRDDSLQLALSRIIVELSLQLPIDTMEEVWNAALNIPPLQQTLSAHYSVTLDSPASDYMRQKFQRERDAEGLRASEKLKSSAWRDGIEKLLNRIEAGDAQLWWQLNLQLFQEPTGSFDPHFEFMSDLTQTPGWGALEASQQARIIRTASDYLVKSPLAETSWLGTNTSHRPANAGLRALRLLWENAPDTFAALSDETWATWSPAAVGFLGNDFNQEDAQRHLVREAYRKAPAAVMLAVQQIATGSGSKGLSSHVLDLLEWALDSRLASFLRDLDQSHGLTRHEETPSILGFLVRNGDGQAVASVIAALEKAGSDTPPEPSQTALIAEATVELLRRDPQEIWLKLLELRGKDEELARAIWAQFAEQVAFNQGPKLDVLSEYDLAQGYIDLVSLLPERPSQEAGGRLLRSPDFVEQLRSILLSRLVGRGTSVSLEQLHRVKHAVPDGHEALQWSIEEARRNVRANHVRREDPADVLARISTMGLQSAPEELQADRGRKSHLDALADGQIEIDVPAPKVREAGALPEAERKTILAVASEWMSLHGGISTLNRELCRALAALGHTVICLVPDATEAEINDATGVKVNLVACPESVGIAGIDRLLLCQAADIGGLPELVLGHDHITGRFAKALATRFHAKYVHFLHTIPQENEGLKSPRADRPRNVLGGETKLQNQLDLAGAANLVVAIGPRIQKSFLAEAIDPPPVCVLVPGLNPDLLTLNPDPAKLHLNMCIMSARMEDAVAKGGMLACNVIKIVGNGREWTVHGLPVLIMRGFSEDANAEFARIGELSDYAQFVQPRSFTTDPLKLTNGYLKAALILMPSVAEGFGLTGLEAIAAGVPVVISSSSGLADYLRGAVTNDGLSRELVESCIAPVHLSEEETRNAWAEKVDAALFNREEAFQRAADLRKALRLQLTWEHAARRLSSEFSAL